LRLCAAASTPPFVAIQTRIQAGPCCPERKEKLPRAFPASRNTSEPSRHSPKTFFKIFQKTFCNL
jgi:hypothetical protein